MGIALFIGVSSDTLAKFVLPFPTSSCSTGLEVLFPKGQMFPPGGITMIPLNWNLRMLSGHFGLLMSPSKQAKG